MEYADQYTSRRIGGLAFVALLHVALIYALLNGLGREAVEVLRQPLETKLIEELQPPPPEPPPPPPPVLVTPPPPYIPPPEAVIQAPPPPHAITAVTTEKPIAPAPLKSAPPPPAPPAPVVRTPAVIDAAHGCRQPEYPPMSKRLEEAGTVVLQFLIDVDGHVLRSEVESSSGHSRLDQAAADALSKCRFKPGTVDGRPEQSWAHIRYVWRFE